MRQKGTDYIVLDENFGAENYAIGFRRDDNALTLKIQEILDAMIADGAAGEIAVKWFGSDVMLRDVDFPREIKEIEGDTSLQYILDKGELILGLDETFPPMGFRDENGEIVGFDIDLSQRGMQATPVLSSSFSLFRGKLKKWSCQQKRLIVFGMGCRWTKTESRDLTFPSPILPTSRL